MMKKLMGIAIVATAVLGLLAGSVLAGPSGPQGGDQDQTQDRACTQTCDPAQDCDGDPIQDRLRTRQSWPDEDGLLGLLFRLFGIK